MVNDPIPDEVSRHGAYICVRPFASASDGADTASAIAALATRFAVINEFDADGRHPADAIAYLRTIDTTPAAIGDEGLLHATCLIHVASADAGRVTEFCDEAERLLGASAATQTLRGVVRPTKYTSGTMHGFAYAQQVQQQPGRTTPHAFLVPMRKTAEWWAKNWMERHTFFLPRYDEHGRMLNEGHALAAAAGIASLMRRTYKHPSEPAPEGVYEFINYFECADAAVPTFHQVCAALRDVTRNPEWRFVREGPTWHGRRVATAAEMFA
jgi:hypothetical protein